MSSARFFALLTHRRLSTAPAPAKPITLRARPVLFISTFFILHPTLTTLTFVPAYTYFRLSDTSFTYLAGPYAAFVLRQRLPFTQGERTVEDLVDAGVRAGWRLVTVARGRWSGRSTSGDEERAVEEELKWLRDRVSQQTRWMVRGWKYAVKARTGVELGRDGTARKVMDATAAYLVVKTLFPVRLAASVFLTPRLARVFARRWG